MAASSDLNLLEDVIQSARAYGADAADALLYRSIDVTQSQRQGKPEDQERAESSGAGLRVFIGQKIAQVSSTDLSKAALEEMAERAVAMARFSTDDPYAGLAPQERLVKNAPALDLAEIGEPSLNWLSEQAAATENAALNVEGITNSEGADASFSRTQLSVVTSHGVAQSYETTSSSLSVSVIAGEGDGMQRDYAYSVAHHRSDLRAAAAIGAEAATRTLERLNPRKVKTQSAPILMEPRIARSFVAQLAGAMSGSAVARGTSCLKEKMGERIASASFSLIDEPHRLRGLGSKPFDAEGVANHTRLMIEDGRLMSWFLDCRSARQLGLETTGHAVRGLGSPPSPSSTNLTLLPGRDSPQEMIKAMGNGFYVTEAFGMGLNAVTGDYSQGASGFWIEGGEIAYPVSELTIAGNLFEMLQQVTPANDLRYEVSTNSPSLLFETMMVAGL